MKKFLLTFLSFILMVSVVDAKEPQLLWERSWDISESNRSVFTDSATSGDGNHYAVGTYKHYEENYNFYYGYYYNGVLIKYDKNGDVLWERKYGDTYDNIMLLSVDTLSDNGCVVVGVNAYDMTAVNSLTTFSSSSKSIINNKNNKNIFNFKDTKFKENDGIDMIMIRYDKDGNVVWERKLNKNVDNQLDFYGTYLSKVNVTSNDNIFVNTGLFNAPLFKYDKNGNRIWNNDLGNYKFDGTTRTEETELVLDFRKDNNDDFITVGTYIKTIYPENSDNGEQPISTNEGTIIKKDSNGKIVFDKKVKLNNLDTIFASVAPDTDDGYLIYALNNDKNNDSTKVILIKTDKNGNQLWTKEIKSITSSNQQESNEANLLLTRIYVDKQGSYVFVDYLLPTDTDKYDIGDSESEYVHRYKVGINSIKIYDKDMNLLWTRNTDFTKEMLIRLSISNSNDYLITGGRPIVEYKEPMSGKNNNPIVFSSSLNNDPKDSVIMKYSIDYRINKETEGEGTVDVNLENAKAGEEITIEAKAAPGYRIDKIIVTDKDGNVIKVSGNKFVMPASDVTVKVIFTDSPLVNPKTGAISITFAVIAISVYAFFQYKYFKTKEMSL